MKPAKFYDLSRDAFPFTFTFHDPQTGEVLGEETISEPGVLTVEGQGRPVIVVIRFADGTYTWKGPE